MTQDKREADVIRAQAPCRRPGFRPSAIALIAFDFDGTLVDSNAVKSNAFHQVLDRQGFPLEWVDDALAEEPHADRSGTMRLVAERAVRARLGDPPPRALAQRLVEDYGKICRAGVAGSADMPGMRACVQSLAASGRTLIVNSSTPEDELREPIAARGLGDMFARVCGRPRTKEQILLDAMTEFEFRPVETVIVGDQMSDAVAAASVGCHLILVLAEGRAPVQAPEGTASLTLVQDLVQLGALFANAAEFTGAHARAGESTS